MIDIFKKLGLIFLAADTTLADGTVISIEGNMEVGSSVYITTADGKQPMPDGSYELENCNILVVKDGKIESIDTPTPAAESDATATEAIVEAAIAADTATGTTETSGTTTEAIAAPTVDDAMLEIKSLKDELATLRQDFTDYVDSVKKMQKEISEFKTNIEKIEVKATPKVIVEEPTQMSIMEKIRKHKTN